MRTFIRTLRLQMAIPLDARPAQVPTTRATTPLGRPQGLGLR